MTKKNLEDFFCGFFLLVCFLVSIMFIFVAFTAQEFQNRVRQLNAKQSSGTIYAMGTLEIKASEFQAINDRLRRLSEERSRLSTCLRKFRSRTIESADNCSGYLTIQKQIVEAQVAVATTRYQLLNALYAIRSKKPIQYSTRTNNDLLQFSAAILQSVDDEISARRGPMADELKRQRENLADKREKFGEALANDPVFNGRDYDVRDQTEKSIEQLRGESEEIEKGLKNQDQEFLRLIDDANAYRDVLFGWPYGYVTLPSITLTLIITVFMGILGSAIALTREFVFDGTTYNMSQYLFRVGLSASVAIAVFFAASAGILVVAKPGAGDADGGVEISPYLLAFLAIVAGYLSLRVTSWLGEIGAGMFKLDGVGAEMRARYGVGLSTAIENSRQRPDEVAALVGISPDQFREVVEGTRPLPFAEQRLISVALRRQIRELFTDIPQGKLDIRAQENANVLDTAQAPGESRP